MRTFLIFMGVWFTASFLNGLLSGICLAVFGADSYAGTLGNIGLSYIFSFILSVPFVGFVWLVTIIAQANGQKGHSLFQTILSTTFICAGLAAIFFITTMGTEFKDARFVVGLCIIISAVSGILIFRNQLKTNV